MNYSWDWGILLRAPYADWILSGIGWTLAIALASWLIAVTAGLGIGVLAGLPSRPLRLAAGGYIQLFRNVPPLAQLFLWYFVFPEILPEDAGLWVKRELPYPEFTTAAVAIGLFSASRIAEQVRAAVETVGHRLASAALATGLRPLQVYRLILLPLALRAIVGPLTSESLITVKMSSIALTIGVMELTAESRHIENMTFHGFEAFALATVVYVSIGLGVTAVMGGLNRRLRRTS